MTDLPIAASSEQRQTSTPASTAIATRTARILPAIAAALLMIVIATLLSSRQHYLDTARRTSRNLAETLEAQTQRTLEAVDAALEGLATTLEQHPAISNGDGRRIHDLLARKVSSNHNLRSLTVLDGKGSVIADSSSFPPAEPDRALKEQLREHTGPRKGMFVSGLSRNTITKRWEILLSRRINNQDGSLAGVVIASLDLHRIQSAFERVDMGREGLINLRHIDGELIIRIPYVEGAIGRKIPSTAQAVADFRSKGDASGEMVSIIDGIERIYTARVMPDAPFVIFASISKAETLAPWLGSAAGYLVAALALAGVIVVLRFLLVREMQCRDALLASLAESEAMLRRHRDHLQEAVEQRTHDLEVAKNLAEEASRVKSEFLANMSHELRTPMHSILSFAKLGGRRLTGSDADTEKVGHYLSRVVQSADRLLRLLNDLLDLSKLEAGKMSYDMQSVDLRSMVADTMAEFSEIATGRGVEIVMQQEGIAAPVRCDCVRIAQVLRNLLSNAVRFTPPGGRVVIGIASIEATGADRDRDGALDDGIRVSVSDDGDGIPPGELEAIFDKFVQSSKTKSGAGGTGLGLSICREIINQHGGSIWAENGLKGAILRFELPRWTTTTDGRGELLGSDRNL